MKNIQKIIEDKIQYEKDVLSAVEKYPEMFQPCAKRFYEGRLMECEELLAKFISLNLPVMRSLPSVDELRKIQQDRPDTFLTGALYIIDLIERGEGNGA